MINNSIELIIKINEIKKIQLEKKCNNVLIKNQKYTKQVRIR